MKKITLFPMILGIFLITSCMENSKKSDKVVFTQNEDSTSTTGWQSHYDRMEATDLPDNVIDLIGKQWMLVTAGNKSSYNTMTAAWGGVGYMWSRPSTFIVVRDSRHTYQFLQREESFTLSFLQKNIGEHFGFVEQNRDEILIKCQKQG